MAGSGNTRMVFWQRMRVLLFVLSCLLLPTIAAAELADTKPEYEGEETQQCGDKPVIYPSWPPGFTPNVSAVFIAGTQKGGSTWLWHMLNAHPCLLSPLQPAFRTGAITTKETYYFTSLNVSADARYFLVPWLGLDPQLAASNAAADCVQAGWFEEALAKAQHASGSAVQHAQWTNGGRGAHIVYSTPAGKLGGFRQCERYFLLEATPHNLHTPIAAARIRRLFPDAKVVAILKNPVMRMLSAYNQFGAAYRAACEGIEPQAWCPIFRYYRLLLPSFSQMVQHDLEYLRKRGCTFQEDWQLESWARCFGCQLMDPWRQPALYNHPYAPSVALGMYAPMLAAWLKHFPAAAFKLVNHEELSRDTMGVVNGVLEALGLEQYSTEQWSQILPEKAGFRGRYSDHFKPDDREHDHAKSRLKSFYRSLNDQLDRLCQLHNISWTPFSDF